MRIPPAQLLLLGAASQLLLQFLDPFLLLDFLRAQLFDSLCQIVTVFLNLSQFNSQLQSILVELGSQVSLGIQFVLQSLYIVVSYLQVSLQQRDLLRVVT